MSTDRPSAIEIGMPVAIRREQQREQQHGARRLRQLDDVEARQHADEREHDRHGDDQRRRIAPERGRGAALSE